MKKQQNKNNLLIIILAAVLLIVGAFFLLGGPEKVRKAYRGYQARTMYAREFVKLDQPLKQLGFSSLMAESQCQRDEMSAEPGEELLCVATNQQYTVIGKEAATKQAFAEAAKELDTALKENGWTTFSNTAKSYEEWMKAVTSGVDYNTDINAHVNTKEGRCGISMTVAYSNPAPPAINTVLTCNSPAHGNPADGGLFFISNGDA